jgi:hypothetical protein
VRTLRDVRKYGLAAHFQRTWNRHIGMVLSVVWFSCLSVRSMQEQIFFNACLPADNSQAASGRSKNGIADGRSGLNRAGGDRREIDQAWHPSPE